MRTASTLSNICWMTWRVIRRWPRIRPWLRSLMNYARSLDAARAKLDADGRSATLTNIDRHMNSLTVAIAAN